MAIEFKNVSYIYMPGTSLETVGLKNINFTLKENEFIALVGHTGSGKSTLMQMFNALLKPTTGEIKISGYTITPATNNKNLKNLRKHVSLAFQFPESQLFEDTVIKDIAFGPKNFGYTDIQAKEQALKWLQKVGLAKDLADKSPFDLSGGQMRRVALAGVMAYEPDILLLDEPAAGLDPAGRKQMMDLFLNYQRQGHTVILVTHNMDDVANYATDVLVMEHGNLIKHAIPRIIFSNAKWLKEHHLNEPTANAFAKELEQGNFKFDQEPMTMSELVKGIEDNLLRNKTHE